MSAEYSAEERQQLLQLARDSIAHGLEHGAPLMPGHADYAEHLLQPRACFVTLHVDHDQLRGCIGSLEAMHPLVDDVARNAYAAAFEDPRFQPLAQHELAQLHLHISVLSPRQVMHFSDEADLLSQVRAGTDGLVIIDDHHRGTFLPSVWESLPMAKDFLAHLKLKAGLSPEYWSDTIRVERYTTESFSD